MSTSTAPSTTTSTAHLQRAAPRPVKWAGDQLELVRESRGGRLVAKAAAAGTAGPICGTSPAFVNQNAVTALRADVTVSSSSPRSFAQARLVGAFYNDAPDRLRQA